MFHSASNPIAFYKKNDQEIHVEGASPHQLILLLFTGAEQAIALAKVHMDGGNFAEKGLAISKAIDIIEKGLKGALDVNAGGEIAENLAALYDYMVRRLLYANLKNQMAALDEVLALLNELHGAWSEIGQPGSDKSPPHA